MGCEKQIFWISNWTWQDILGAFVHASFRNATGRSLTGCCDGDDKDVDDIIIEDAEDGDVAIMISQSIVILSFFTREKLDALLRNRKFMQNKVTGKWMKKLLSKPTDFQLFKFQVLSSAFTDVPRPPPELMWINQCSPQTDVTSLLKVHELIQGITQDNQVESVICKIMFKSVTPLSQKQYLVFYFTSYVFVFVLYIYKITFLPLQLTGKLFTDNVELTQ